MFRSSVEAHSSILEVHILGCKHLSAYIPDLKELRLNEIHADPGSEHLMKAIQWHASGPFRQVINAVREGIFPNYRHNLSLEE